MRPPWIHRDLMISGTAKVRSRRIMRPSEKQRAANTRSHQKEYGDGYALLSWVTPAAAAKAESRRQELLERIGRQGTIGASGTKMDMSRLSPGCRLCVAGQWSCLFINGKCNGRCFYCPTPQDDIGSPITNTLPFASATDYAAYIEAFGFSGVSISGGEPLLTLDRVIDYIQTVKQRFEDKVHTWLYTNGTRVTRNILTALRDAGLDEIRFNIGATAYHLKKAAMAAGIIPTVTVEIPAVPEELIRLKNLTASMSNSGVSHLNLHQLRLTPHNFKHIAGRGYTFIHGDLVTVLESELAALEVVDHVLSHDIRLGVNYCSFVYKHHYQKAAARRRAAGIIRKPYEDITEKGFIRTLSFTGPTDRLAETAEWLKADETVPATDWFFDPKAGRLYVCLRVADRMDATDLTASVYYAEATLLPAITYLNPFREIRLTRNKKIFVERTRRLAPTPVPQEFLSPGGFAGALATWEISESFEGIPHGLADYY